MVVVGGGWWWGELSAKVLGVAWRLLVVRRGAGSRTPAAHSYATRSTEARFYKEKTTPKVHDETGVETLRIELSPRRGAILQQIS